MDTGDEEETMTLMHSLESCVHLMVALQQIHLNGGNIKGFDLRGLHFELLQPALSSHRNWRFQLLNR